MAGRFGPGGRVIVGPYSKYGEGWVIKGEDDFIDKKGCPDSKVGDLTGFLPRLVVLPQKRLLMLPVSQKEDQLSVSVTRGLGQLYSTQWPSGRS